MSSEYELAPLGKDEGEALTKELQEVLAKYNAEMGVTSNIHLLKRVPKATLSPIQPKEDGHNAEENTTNPEENKAD